MALTGDFARLDELRRMLRAIAAGGALRTRLLPALATEVHKQVVSGFVQQRDPYGRAWKPRRSGGSWPILRRTDTMVRSIRARPTPRGVSVTAVGYAGFHQEGTVHMAQRRIVPDPIIGLGPIWGGAINRVASDTLRALAGGV